MPVARRGHISSFQYFSILLESKSKFLSVSVGTFTYDDLNRKLTDTVNFGPFTKDIACTWAANSQKSSYTNPSVNVYNYVYVNNQLAGIELPGTGTITTSAYKWNRPATIQYPGGTRQTRTYAPLMRLTSVTDQDPGSNNVMAYTYTHDPLDNITQKSTEHGDYTYDYDTLQRLTSADNPETQTDEAFTYDAVGNRLTDAENTDTWTYNQNNELETHSNTSYEYDDYGNTVKKTLNGVTTLFFYNLEDRLERVEDESGNIITKYGYDPFGRRLWKETSGTKTYFMYADKGLIGEYTATGTEIKTYGWKPGSTWGTDPLFMKIGSQYYFYHNDHLGTPQKMTSISGAVVWSAKYTSFGKAEIDADSTVENSFRFLGQHEDVDAGLHYNRYRYYDPDTGRYATADPIGFLGGPNLYAYASNDPINSTDPWGLWPYYKRWGGPDHTAGKKGSWDSFSDAFRDDIRKQIRDGWDPNSRYRPLDAQDTCYMYHDICYGECRMKCSGEPCPIECERKGLNKCDHDLKDCLIGIGFSGNVLDEARRIAAIPVFELQPANRNAIAENKKDGGYRWFTWHF